MRDTGVSESDAPQTRCLSFFILDLERMKLHENRTRLFWQHGIRRSGDESPALLPSLLFAEADHRARREAGPLGGQRGGRRHAGLGRGERRHPLHPLVPAPHWHYRGEARQLHLSRAGRPGHHGVLRQGADQRGARRLLVPFRWSAGHL